MKKNFLRKCSALVLTACILTAGTLSAGLTAKAEQDAPAAGTQQAGEESRWRFPAPAEAQASYDQYLGALLDFLYRNDPQAFVALGLGTAEEAAELYNRELGLDAFCKGFTSSLGIDLPEALINDLKMLMIRIISSARYAVSGCELQADGTYEVTVIYEQLQVFAPTMELFEAVFTELTESWYASPDSYPGNEDMMIQIIAALFSSLRVCLDNPVYAAPALTTVTIEPSGGAYIPNPEDLASLEALFYDTEAVLD
ncbi:MAG: hypothetical protein K2P63_05900 [Lachnospiraceae bacterium]|nr:hypothetical protein [Lachnospiraceae bacterium]